MISLWLWIYVIAPSFIFMRIVGKIILHHLLRHELNLIPFSLDHWLILFLIIIFWLVWKIRLFFRKIIGNSIIWFIEQTITILIVVRLFLRKICEIFASLLVSSLLYRINPISIGVKYFLESINNWVKTSIYHNLHFWE